MTNDFKPLLIQAADGTLGMGFPPDASYQQKAQNLVAWLGNAKIPYNIQYEKTTKLGFDSGRTVFGSDTGQAMTYINTVTVDKTQREAFVEKGGILIIKNHLNGVSFSKSRSGDELRVAGTLEMENKLSGLGIKFEKQDSALVINGAEQLCAIALSGATFNGAAEYLRQHGYVSR